MSQSVVTGLDPEAVRRLNASMLDMWVLPEAQRQGYKFVWLRAPSDGEPEYFWPDPTSEEVRAQPTEITVPLKKPLAEAEQDEATGQILERSRLDWLALRANPDHLLLDFVEVRLPGETPPEVYFNDKADPEVFRWVKLEDEASRKLLEVHPEGGAFGRNAVIRHADGTEEPLPALPQEVLDIQQAASAAREAAIRPYGLIVWDLARGRLYSNVAPEVINGAAQGTLAGQADTLEARKSETYPVQTSEEWTALQTAAADGRTQANWRARPEDGQLVHQVEGAPYFVRLSAEREEPIDDLVSITQEMDADSVFGLLYVSELLAPAQPLAHGEYAGGRIYLDDVIEKIGLDPRSTAERHKARQWVYTTVIEFGRKAHVVGRRSGRKYKDPATGQEIDTYIDASLWTTLNPERPSQPAIPGFSEVPISIELIASREWTRLTTAAATRQFLPCGEVLGSIPRGQAGGAWARVIGLAFMNFARRNPSGRVKPTRRELLTTFTPAKSPPLDILEGNDPGRALRYWREALRMLVERGIMADEGEAATPARPKGYTWQEDWLNAKVDLKPGPKLAQHVKERAIARAEKAALPKRRRKPNKKPKG